MGQRQGAGWRVGIALVWLVGLLFTGAEPSAAQTVPVPVPSANVRIGGGNTPGAVRLRDGREAAADRVIVRFRDNTAQGEQDDAHRIAGRRIAVRATPRPTRQIAGGSQVIEVAGASVEDTATAYRADPRVLYAQPDFVRYASETPFDPSTGSQYGLTRIGAPAAWNVTHGSPTIKIAVLDCGIRETHPDLVGKVVLSRDFTGSSFGTDDRCNHGTHVAGTASAVTNNGVGVAGVGYHTSLMNGKVLHDDSNGFDSEIANGIHWAADNGANVINMSLGGKDPCSAAPVLQEAVTYAWNRNVVVVAAAGNSYNTDLQVPASCDNVVSVASTDSNDAKSSFSTYGTWVDIAAPGSSILSTVNPDISGGSTYGYKSGTSMATPHVAGVAALIFATSYGTSAQAVVNRMNATADAIAGTGTNWQVGRVNVGAAVAGGGSLPAPALASLAPASATAGGAAFTLTVNGANFNNGATVRWNGAGRPTTYVSATRLTAAITAADIAAATTATVTAANPDGQVSGGLSFGVLPPPPPAISAVSPGSAMAEGAAFTLTVDGANFRNGATVRWNGAARPTTYVNATRLTANITAADIAATGAATVTVANTDGQVSGGLSFTITPAPLSLTGVAPNSGVITGGQPVTLTGRNFRTGVMITIGGNACAVGAASGTAITCTTPPGAPGSASVTVTNTDGTSATLAGAYMYTMRAAGSTAPGGATPNVSLPARALAPIPIGPNTQPNPAPMRR